MYARAAWKALVASSYLVAAVILLPVLVEFVLERTGVLHGPSLEGELPQSVLIFLLFDALAVNGLALLYWPVAIVIALFFWKRDRQFAIPAILFLIADGSFFLNAFLALPDSGPLFYVCIAFGWLFAIAAVRAWFLWARGKI